MVPLGEMRIHMILENVDEIEATNPRVEAFIDLLRYEILRSEVVSAQGRVHELRGEHAEAIERYQEERRLKPSRPHLSGHGPTTRWLSPSRPWVEQTMPGSTWAALWKNGRKPIPSTGGPAEPGRRQAESADKHLIRLISVAFSLGE